ncbi:alkaline phosphatase family protein [bacterium]|nr:alkaline phosphatase family protein [bacterium]MDB4293876.1 alkaline phosphatase family protein [Akkermansiaceae bacterium]MDB4327966.1 alkaline phosphatase family protein [Akkermansiaceae bacterium]
MKRVAVLNVVGLCKRDLAEMPRLKAWSEKRPVQSFKPAFPAVTCTAQSSYLTGRPVGEHGIVGNGWYDRDAAEVKFWKQSNHLVKGEKVWENQDFTCAKMFWWYNMYSTADFSATPRPLYPADGRKFFDIHTQPMEMREAIKADLGDFPFPSFWGPKAGIPSSDWLAKSARWIEEKEQPGLNLVYLPHLDYGLQKFGPGAPEMAAEYSAIDDVTCDLIDFLESQGVEVLVLSEYGISKVSKAVHLNRVFREKGWIQIKDELGLETLDCGGCQAFAVADHQVAHVYINDPAIEKEVRKVVLATDGVESIREADDLWGPGAAIGKERGGDFVAVSDADAWFTYYYWIDDAKAPDFARCIDIHRKPGYDPVELFLDPEIKFPIAKIGSFLIKKKLGFRGLMDVIPLDANLVKGSHGRDDVPAYEQPIAIGPGAETVASAEAVFHWIRAASL